METRTTQLPAAEASIPYMERALEMPVGNLVHTLAHYNEEATRGQRIEVGADRLEPVSTPIPSPDPISISGNDDTGGIENQTQVLEQIVAVVDLPLDAFQRLEVGCHPVGSASRLHGSAIHPRSRSAAPGELEALREGP